MTDSSGMVKWIDLKDSSAKSKLKVMVLDDESGAQRKFLVILGLPSTSDKWKKATELLSFSESPNKKYLIRQVLPGEKITATMFRPVWQNAALGMMPIEDARMDMKSAAKKKIEEKAVLTEEDRTAAVELGEITRLGRNADGEIVFKSPLGRYIERKGGKIYEGSALLSPALFLHANNLEEERICADGFVQGMVYGEAQQTEDLMNFMGALNDAIPPFPIERIDAVTAAIESAVMRHLTTSYQNPQDAYGDSARLYDLMPPFQGTPRGVAALPVPLAIMAQRLLGDTADKDVVFPDAFDGASFSFLPAASRIRAYRGSKDISAYARNANAAEAVWGDSYDPSSESLADLMFINKDPGKQGQREDYTQSIKALKGLKPEGRAVLALAAGPREGAGILNRESRDFYDYLCRTFELEAAFEIPAQLTNRVGSNRPLRVVSIKNRRPRLSESFGSFAKINSWDDAKSYVDEAIVKVNLKEVESESVDVESVAKENDYQRPYIAFSKVGNATTMVPKNLQGPLQAALSNIEFLEGNIDRFVETELQFGENTLGDRFSAEQVDALAIGISSIKQGRALILGDEPGAGKGRTLAGFAVWANKQGKNVIFITEKANLFSDFVRDLRDTGEWGRFNPIIMNNVSLVDDKTSEIIHEGTPSSEMKNMVDNLVPLESGGYNIIFTTYSQISSEDSPKAEWLLQEVQNSIFIADEAHVAAGSDSNMSHVVFDMQTRAWGVVYSSGTWAKSSENLHIYSRAFPPAINIATLTASMRSGGAGFAEVFSSMLAYDGAFIRREHDLSKVEISVEIDTINKQRNIAISDSVSEVLGLMTYVGGEISRLLMRANSDTMSAVRQAREVHGVVATAIRDNSKAKSRRRSQAAQSEQEADVTDVNTVAEIAEGGVRVEAVMPVGEPEVQVSKPVSLFKTSFGAGSVIYQVMRNVLAVLSVDNVARLAIRSMEQNRKPIIIFDATGETALRELVEGMTLPGIDGEAPVPPTHVPVPTIREMLMKIVARMGVVQNRQVLDTDLFRRTVSDDGVIQEEIDVDDVLGGSSSSDLNLSLEDLPGISEEQREAYLKGISEIVELIQKLPPLPMNGVDVLRGRLQAVGARVGEMSGRSLTLEMPDSMRNVALESDWDTDPANRMWKIAYRKANKNTINLTAASFNRGDLDVVILNRSAATGISLHSSEHFEDKRPRDTYEWQSLPNMTERDQSLHRGNRKGQVNDPRIYLPTTGIYGEVRQLITRQKNSKKLYSHVRSSGESALDMNHIPDILNPVGEAICRRFLMDNSPIRQRLGITDSQMEDPAFSTSNRFTAYSCLLLNKIQESIYEEIQEAFDEEIIRLDLLGMNPLRSKELDIRAEVVKSRIAIGVEMEGLGSVFDGPVYMRELAWTQELRPLEWEDVKDKIKASREMLLTSNLAALALLEPIELPKYASDIEQIFDEMVAVDEFEDDASASSQTRVTLEDLANGSVGGISTVAASPDDQSLQEDREADLVLPDRLALVSSLDMAYAKRSNLSAASFSIEAFMGNPDASLTKEDSKIVTMAYRKSQEIYSSLNMDRIANTMGTFFGGRSSLALAGTEYQDVPAALRSQKKNAVREMWAKRMWILKNFVHIQPGCLIGIEQSMDEYKKKTKAQAREEDRFANMFRERAIITALIPPPKGKEAQINKWKLEVVVPGDEKVRQISLNKLIEDVSLMALLRGDSDRFEEMELTGGPILHGFCFAGQPVMSDYDPIATVREKFETAPNGVIDRKGYVLEGNMYLASEWAQATGKAHGVIYTDKAGVRHRAQMMNRETLYGDRDLFAHLPVRLWVPSMINRFVDRIWNPREGEDQIQPNGGTMGATGRDHMYLFKTDFSSAMSDTQVPGKNSSQLLVVPGKLIAITLDPKDMGRVARAMRSESKRQFVFKHPHYKLYTPEQKEQAKADTIKISTSAKRGKSSLVSVEAGTFEQASVAIDLISTSVGLELYIWPHSRAGQVGTEVVAQYFEKRREEARAIRDAARIRREEDLPVVERIQDASETRNLTEDGEREMLPEDMPRRVANG